MASRGPRAADVITATQQSLSPSVSGVGGTTNLSSLARNRPTSFSPGRRRSVLTRSPVRTGTSDGAITSNATPIEVNSRHSANPPGPASQLSASPSGAQTLDKPADRLLGRLNPRDLRPAPAGGRTAATIENSCISKATHRRRSTGAIEIPSGMAGPLKKSYAALVTILTRVVGHDYSSRIPNAICGRRV